MLKTAFIAALLGLSVSDKCEYPSSSNTERAFDRLAVDQETDLIPKVCLHEDACGNGNNPNDVCVRDPDVLSPTVGCVWCENKDEDTCESRPSDDVTPNDFYQCFRTTPESCGMSSYPHLHPFPFAKIIFLFRTSPCKIHFCFHRRTQ